MTLWETQDPYCSHESGPFKYNKMNTADSIMKQRGGTTSIATTKTVERTKIVESSTSTFDNKIFRFSPGPKSSSSSPLSIIHHLPHITYERQIRTRSASSTASNYVQRLRPHACCVRPFPSLRNHRNVQGLLTHPR